MKYALVGDFHGSDLRDLEVSLGYVNPDVLISTSDFDQTKTIHQFMDLEKRYKANGKQVIKVPGNHDHAILTDMDIISETMEIQGKDSHQLHLELNNDLVAKKYIDDLVNSKDPHYTNKRVRIFLDEGRFDKDYRTAVIHGAYDGNMSSCPRCPRELEDLWTRLLTPTDHFKNFRIMEKNGHNVMVRGHDHVPMYVYEDPKQGIVECPPIVDGNTVYKLFKHQKHTINPGAIFDGIFAVIDTNVPGEEVPILTYFHL